MRWMAPVLLVLVAPFALASERPYGLQRRLPWNDSRVVGFPGEPPPYRAVRAFPQLKIVCPMGVIHQPHSDRLLLIHQLFPWGGQGKILRIRDAEDVDKAEEVLTVDGIAYGIAFHPRFAENGYLYIGDNGPLSGKKQTRVTRYTMDRKPPYRLDPASAKVILAWDSDGHNGGDLGFGPDGYLYITSGDGTSDSDTNLTGQDMSKLLAKVLRIDVDRPDADKAYTVPGDNPFVGRPGIRPETWAYGFRNPWRIHVDRQNGDVWVGNNGQDLWEQIFLVRKGANYGWSAFEGSHPFYPSRLGGPSPHARPIAEHHHSEARSMTGGVVYRGAALKDLHGAYIYGDWSTGRIWGLRHDQGRVIWHKLLAVTPMQITGFGLDSRGELLIADHGGGFYRLELAPRQVQATPFPTRLSDTGLFSSVIGHKTHASLIPYSVQAQLWSDGAHKERFIALPGTTQIEPTANNGWNFPEGGVLVKTFSLDTPQGLRRIETRLLTRQVGQWYGYSYAWNEAQTEADLVVAEGTDRAYPVRDASAANGQRTQTWHYPSRTECMVCHSRAANFVLGLSTDQMNKMHDYGSVRDSQLRALEHAEVFKVNLLDHFEEARRRWKEPTSIERVLVRDPVHALLRLAPGIPESLAKVEKALKNEAVFTTYLSRTPGRLERLVDPQDRSAPLEARARAYLHTNCAICHVEAGGGNAQFDVHVRTPLAKMRLVDAKPLHDTFGIPGARLIVPGDPERSILYQRMKRRGPGQMPPLATSRVDEDGVALVGAWIRSMKGSP